MNLRNLLLLVFMACLSNSAFAQSKINLYLAQKMNSPVQDEVLHVLVEGDVSEIKRLTTQLGGTYKYDAGNIASITVLVKDLPVFINNNKILRIEARPVKYQLLNDTAAIQNNVLKVHQGMAPLPQGYDGSGVVIGIIDTGIDINHGDFKDSTGKTRIQYIWDHKLLSGGTTPVGYKYGQEWSKAAIDSGLATAHKDEALNGHGTHVAGIAAGNGNQLLLDKTLLDSLKNKGYVSSDFNGYRGVAPKADIIVVAIDFNSNVPNRVADAVNYIYSKAKEMGKPCVINISMATSYEGSHDGKDKEAELIDNLIKQESGRSLVAAAGNAGGYAFHLGYNVNSDTSFTWFAYNSAGIYIQMWADTSKFKNVRFSIGADQVSPSYSFRGNINFSNIADRLNKEGKDTLYNSMHERIGVIQSYGSIYKGTYLMEWFIVPDSTTYRWRLMTTGSGTFDTWSFDVVSSNLPSSAVLPDMVYYKMPDANQTLANSYQCSPHVITVGNYINKKSYRNYDGAFTTEATYTPGALFAGSSVGPTRDGRIKPDIAATGTFMLSSITLANVAGYLSTNQGYKLAPGGKHVRNTGTSMASPVVAGIAALYLQKNQHATYMDVKNAILNCAKRDALTGNNLPNNSWGYGKADAYNTMKGCITNAIIPNKQVVVTRAYPNPFLKETTISYDLSDFTDAANAEIQVFNLLGEMVKSIFINEKSGKVQLYKDELKSGIYFYNLTWNKQVLRTEKLIIL